MKNLLLKLGGGLVTFSALLLLSFSNQGGNFQYRPIFTGFRHQWERISRIEYPV